VIGIAEQLGSAELFGGLSDNELQAVAAVVDRTVWIDEGSVVCEEGTPADEWWVVLDGEADVTIGGVFLGVVGAGESIGELAALDRSARSATVTARTGLQLGVVGAERFDELLDVAPSITKALLRQMAARLRRASVAAMRENRAGVSSAGVSSAGVSSAVSGALADRATTPQLPADASALELFSPAFFADPYQAYAALRDQSPAVYNELVSSWIVSRYADVAALLRDRTVSSEIEKAAPSPFVDSTIRANAELGDPRTVGRFDGADHTRIRRLVSSAFTPRAMQNVRHSIVETAETLLARAAGLGAADFVEHVALPLPSMIISRMLGVPEADMDQLHDWSVAASLVPEPLATPAEQVETKLAVEALRAYMLDLSETKRSNPQDDVLTGLTLAHHEGERLSRAELVDNAALLYIAGHITTVNLLASMMSFLAANPDQMALLRRDPSLQANAVEEVLRLEPPAQFGRRYSTADITLEDCTIPAGSSIITAMGAANRDPRHWGADADEFRVNRVGAHQHLSFAAGAHFCAGAALARLEAQVVLDIVMREYPHFVVPDPSRQWGERLVLRGLRTLPVRLNG
jgi:cytochrome P450/CRP-like cAMP-binding protein